MTARVLLNALAVLRRLDSADSDPWTGPGMCQADIFLRIDAVAARSPEMSPWLVLLVQDSRTTDNALTVRVYGILLHHEECTPSAEY